MCLKQDEQDLQDSQNMSKLSESSTLKAHVMHRKTLQVRKDLHVYRKMCRS